MLRPKDNWVQHVSDFINNEFASMLTEFMHDVDKPQQATPSIKVNTSEPAIHKQKIVEKQPTFVETKNTTPLMTQFDSFHQAYRDIIKTDVEPVLKLAAERIELMLNSLGTWVQVTQAMPNDPAEKILVYHPDVGVDRGYVFDGKVKGGWQFGAVGPDPTHWRLMPAGPSKVESVTKTS